MNRRVAAAACAALFTAGAPLAARAVDRSLGAGVAKPPATGAPWSDADRDALRHDLDALLESAPALRGAHAGLLLAEPRGGAPLYARNDADAFVPASTQKLITGSAALDALGPRYRLRTAAYLRDGKQLVISGGGDPLLASGDLDGLVAALKASGTTTLPSSVAVDGARYGDGPYPPGWSVDDLAYDYAAPVRAVLLEHNAVHVVVAPGPRAGTPATVTARTALPGAVGWCLEGCPATLEFHVTPRVQTAAAGAPDTVDVARLRENTMELIGAIPTGAAPDEFDLAVPDGGVYLRGVVLAKLAAAGITAGAWSSVGRPLRTYDVGAFFAPAGPAVWTHDSEPLADLLADCWQPSDNLLAEVLLHETGIAQAGLPGTTAKGITAIQQWLRGIGAADDRVTLSDGSGLSVYDRVTPRALVAVLQHDWSGPYRDIVLDALPIAGVRGTLATSFTGTPAERRVYAKTGTVTHASTLAGYIATLHHGTVAFAFLVDDWAGSTPDALRDLRARVLARIVAS